jgi:site-specific recombinase XerD
VWCTRQGLALAAADIGAVERWVDALTRHGYAAPTRGRMVSAVSALYRHLIRCGLAATNPAAGINRRTLHLNRGPAPATTKPWTWEQSRALLHAAYLLAEHTRNGSRDRAMTEILVSAAPRADELVGINLDDYHRHPGGGATLRVHGKGGKDRELALSPPVADALDAYLAIRVAPAVPALPGHVSAGRADPVFVSGRGRRLHASHVTAMLRQLCHAFCAYDPADPDAQPRARWHQTLLTTHDAHRIAAQLAPIATTIHPHSARHTYTTLAIGRGVPLRQVQLDLGHTDPRTTEGYLHDQHTVANSAAHDLSPGLHRGWLTGPGHRPS